MQRSAHHGVHAVIDIGEVAELFAAPYFKRPAGEHLPDPHAEEGLAGVLDAHTRPDGVGEAQRAGADAVHVVVEDMVPFAGHLVDAVDVDGADGVVFIHGQIVGFAVNLPRSGEYDADARIGVPAGFEDGKLRLAVDVQIRIRIGHRIHMAGLSGKIEQKVVPLHQRFHAVGIADVRNIDFEAGFVTANVCRIPAILGDKAVDERNGSAFLKKADAKIGADEPQPSRDEHMRAGIETHYRILRLAITKKGGMAPLLQSVA